MTISKLCSLIFVGLFGGLAGLSQAGVITQRDNLLGNQNINSQQVLMGSFDFSGISLPQSEYLTAASVQFDFFDDFDPKIVQRTGSKSSGYNRSLFDPKDEVLISIAGQSVVTSSPAMLPYSTSVARLYQETFFRQENYIEQQTEYYSCGLFNTKTCSRVVTVIRTRTVPDTRLFAVTDTTTLTGYTGAFSHSLDLSPTWVNQLLSLGSLDFELTGVGGGTAFLRRANVQLTTASSSVPEPESLGLMLMAAVGLLVGKRRF